jgi:4,5-DOPA dioxygenase extradiol
MTKPAKFHYDLAKELAPLRKEGILIVASGNIVHNLGLIAWDEFDTDDFAFDWAREMNEKVKEYILSRNHTPLIEYDSQGEAFRKAIPTPDHFLPLLYILALQEEDEKVTFFNDKAVAGSLTMTSLKID